ncbi:hypothetical protein, partial [Pseudorhizobium marinum]|uniref:hypothetical protein n=1 Tax=Pseudorhizobium marinum TaxID=1496690 RepID=UPI000496CAA2
KNCGLLLPWEDVRSSPDRVGDLMAVEPTIHLGTHHADDPPDRNGGFREPGLDIGMATIGR